MLTKANIDAMGAAANTAISQALAHGPVGRTALRTEPGLVAAVHLRSINAIGRSWSSYLASAGLTMEMTGVFCHQSPMVTFSDSFGCSRRCELADLLIVVDTRAHGIQTRTATLIQAKMASSAGTVTPKGISSQTQLELYQNWPLFYFEQAAYGLSSVDIKQGTDSTLAGTFGIIDRHCHSSTKPRWTQHPATPTPSKTYGSPELGYFLANMVANTSGFGRDADVRNGTPWSAMIESLLKENKKRTFQHHQSLGLGRHPRSMSSLFFMASEYSFFQTFGGTGGEPPEELATPLDEGPTGISAIHITLHEG